MYRILTILLLVSVFMMQAGARSYKVDEIPNVHVADRTRFISNPDGIISSETQTGIDSTLSRLRQQTSAEVVAVIVEDIDGDDIDSYATRLFNSWGLGKKDNNNGVLILAVRDMRKAVIRTGPGVEGVLPDIVCGRILRNDMFPAFKRGDYDGGMAAAVTAVAGRMGEPEAAAELKSSLGDNDESRSGGNPLRVYLLICAAATVILAMIVGVTLVSMRRKSSYDKYSSMDQWRAPLLIISFAGLGLPLLVTLPLLLLMRRWRNRPRTCPNCGHKMVKIDEVHDNDYLTPAQDCEERIGSVDYDVWHCNDCGETDIFPFVNKSMPLTECEHCHARAAKLTGDRVVVQPTVTRQGVGVKDFTCLNCHHVTQTKYAIAKIAPVIVIPPGGGGSGSSGGSFGGGFGGGFTGGGGASGGW